MTSTGSSSNWNRGPTRDPMRGDGISQLITSTSKLKLEQDSPISPILSTRIPRRQSTFANNKVTVKDVMEAYAYHELLENIIDGVEPDEWSYSSDDETESDTESEPDHDDGNEGPGEQGDINGDGSGTRSKPDGEKEDENEDDYPLYWFQSADELTVLPSSPEDSGGCSNAKLRPDMWLSDPELYMTSKMGFPTQVGNACIRAKVRDCGNEACRKKRKEMEANAPACGWGPFRRWAVVAMSCQAGMTPEQKMSVAHTHLARAVTACSSILKEFLDEGRALDAFLDGPSPERVDVGGVCNAIYWMMSIQAVTGTGSSDFGRWNHKLLPLDVTMPSISKAMEQLEGLGVCKNRFWGLVNLSDRKEGDLPDVTATMVHSASSFNQEGHGACTPSKCHYTFVNTTKVEQLHKCVQSAAGGPNAAGAVCHQVEKFPVDILDTALELGHSTAWSCTEKRLCRDNEPYVAISHVWADGTGVGLKNPGTVNRCLFDYFARVAKRLDCNGIWWDSLSVPLEPKARSKALNRMHANYRTAKTTVVHDRYLLDFEWKDDGSPCLAIVLSAWFTRGWTALELAMSERVAVLYKGRDKDHPVIKDLDRDILAKDPSSVSRAHWLASSLIRRLRQRVDNVPDLLAVLKPRFTAKAKDRAEIAGLLAGIRDMNYNRFEGEITQDILHFFGAIPYSCLLHGRPTLRDSGPFSWCTTALEDMPIDLSTDMESRVGRDDEKFLDITMAGAVKGWWEYRALTERDPARLSPYGDDLSTEVKVGLALRDWRSCFLLKEDANEDPGAGVALLVTAVGATGEYVDCRYVGAVRVRPAANDAESIDDDYELGETFQIGNDKGKKPISTEEALKILEETPWEDDDDSSTDEDDEGSSTDDDSSTDGAESAPEPDDKEAIDIRSAGSNGPPPGDKTGVEKLPWWRSEGNAKAYERPAATSHEGKEGETEEDVMGGSPEEAKPSKLSQMSRTDVSHLLYALKARNEKAVRHLIRSEVDLTPAMKGDMEDALGKENHRELAKLLGDAYRESGKLEDAQRAYRHAVSSGKPGITNSEAKQDLASVCVELGETGEAEDLFREVLELCKERMDIKKQKVEAKACKQKSHEQAKSAAAQQPPDSHPSKRAADGVKAKEEKDSEKAHDERVGRLERLEVNAIAGLSLLYADRGELARADEVYLRALKGFGKETPKWTEAFTLDWGDRRSEDFKFRARDTSSREKVYKPAMKQFGNDFGEDHPITLTTALNLGLNFLVQENWTEAEELIRQAMRGFGKKFGSRYAMRTGGEHVITLGCIHFLAPLLAREGKTDDANRMFRRVFDGFSAKLTAEHPLSLAALVNMGEGFLRSNEPARAEEMLMGAKRGYELRGEFGRDHKFTAAVCELLGEAYSLQGGARKAEEALQEAVDRLGRRYKPHHRDLCGTLIALGHFQEDQGRLDEAEANIRKCLEGYKKSAGPEDRATLGAMEALAHLCEKRGDLDEAETLSQAAVKGYDSLLGSYNPLTLRACSNLGSLYRKQKKLEGAAENCHRAYRGYEKSLNTDSPADALLILESAYQVGEVYKEQWKWAQAEAVLSKAVQGFNTTAPSHDLALKITVALGEVYLAEGKRDDAERMWESAVEICSNTFGESDRATLQAVLRLNDLRTEQKKGLDEVELAILRVRDEFENRDAFAQRDPGRFHALLSLGKLKHKQQILEEAELLLREARTTLEVAAPGDLSTFDAMASHGHVLTDLKRPEDALPLIEGAVRGYRELNHPAVLDAMGRLSRLYRKLEQADEADAVDQNLREIYEKLHGASAANVIMQASLKSRLRRRPTLSRMDAGLDNDSSDDEDDSSDESDESEFDWSPFDSRQKGHHGYSTQLGAYGGDPGYGEQSNFPFPSSNQVGFPAAAWGLDPEATEQLERSIVQGVRNMPQDSTVRIGKAIIDAIACRHCYAVFGTRSQLFRHLKLFEHEADISLPINQRYTDVVDELQYERNRNESLQRRLEESTLKHRVAKTDVFFSLCGSSYWFVGSAWMSFSKPSNVHIPEHEDGDKLLCISFGTNQSYYRHYHTQSAGGGRECRTDTSANFGIEYPPLHEFLQEQQGKGDSCPSSVSLGLNENSYIRMTSGAWQYNLKTGIQPAVGDFNDVRDIWLGRSNSYLAVMKDGSSRWDFKGNYTELESTILRRNKTIKAAALNLENTSYIALWEDGYIGHSTCGTFEQSVVEDFRMSNFESE